MKQMMAFCCMLILISCKKDFIQQVQTNLAVQVMTQGQWRVTLYKKGDSDITSHFTPYKFQFKTDLTVDAINDGTIEKTGSWKADEGSKTITATFTNASDTLLLLNGTWKIDDTGLSHVNASQTANGERRLLHLEK